MKYSGFILNKRIVNACMALRYLDTKGEANTSAVARFIDVTGTSTGTMLGQLYMHELVDRIRDRSTLAVTYRLTKPLHEISFYDVASALGIKPFEGYGGKGAFEYVPQLHAIIDILKTTYLDTTEEVAS